MPPDYSGQNLRGRSFKGQNLTGANFSGADIRGANFTNAILKDADFTGAKAGLQRRWVIGLLIISWLLAIISGYLTCMISLLPVYFTETEIKNPHNLFTSIICLFVVAGFFLIGIRKGFTKDLGVSILFISLIVASVFITFFIYNNALSLISLKPIVLSFFFVVPIVVPIAITFSFSLACITASVFIFAGYIAYRITWFLASFLILSSAMSGNLVIGVIALLSELGIYIGLDSVTIGYRKDTFIRFFAIAFAATGGTSFRGADLTDADFTGATLKSTDFRKAKLVRTRFYESKYLYFARVGNSILSNLSVLFLLLTGDGRGKSYAGANLKGANLIGADLKEANLKGADITEATFQRACLESANLTLTQAVGTDFTSAQMTGACVEAWNIESTRH
jgi:uncharacterized protein YjbI with pentapeptide repeats